MEQTDKIKSKKTYKNGAAPSMDLSALESKIEDVKNQMVQAKESVQNKVTDTYTEAESRVKASPLKYMAGAAALGLVLGYIFKRSK
jgi:ElaB/YqjD/DUF883 family membrane-anchored ribosome-binding protein